MTDPELRDFFHALMQEAFAVGKAIGVALDSESNTADGWSLIGLLAFGRTLGIPTLANDAVYIELKLHRLGS
jgi:hypothetical protein